MEIATKPAMEVNSRMSGLPGPDARGNAETSNKMRTARTIPPPVLIPRRARELPAS